jgi:TetR/AcrR family transcriptional regulator, cholesterol catabolism regulator
VKRRTRDRIYEAAEAAFYEKSYDRATLKDIAESAGVPVGNVYYYFKNKEDLLLHILVDRIEQITVSLRAIAETDGPISHRLHAAVAELVTSSVQSPSSVMLGGIEEILDHVSPDNVSVIIAKRHEYESIFYDLVDEGMRQGVVMVQDSHVASLAVLGMATSCKRWFKADGPRTLDDVAGQFADFSLRVLGVPALDAAVGSEPGGQADSFR